MVYMKYCERCGVAEDKVQLYDVIADLKMSVLCERCAIIDNVPIIKKPNTAQLKNFEKPLTVNNRMRSLAGLPKENKATSYFPQDRLNELNKNPSLEFPEKNRLNLIDNFHWEIMRVRRRKGFSIPQLAAAIGESAVALEMIEKGKIPAQADSIIKKIEQFFQIQLRNIPLHEQMIKKQQKPVLRDQEGRPIEIIPEEEFREEIDNEGEIIQKEAQPITPDDYLNTDETLDVKKARTLGVTIGDLHKIHKKKIEVTRQERVEEQKKIEERRRILMAQREQERSKIEERKKQEAPHTTPLDQRQKLLQQHKQEQEKLREKERKDIDSQLGGMELFEE